MSGQKPAVSHACGEVAAAVAPLTTINLPDESIVCDIGVLGEDRG